MLYSAGLQHGGPYSARYTAIEWVLTFRVTSFIIRPTINLNFDHAEPGGYLQWDEADLGKMHIKGAEAEAVATLTRTTQTFTHFDYS